MGENPFLRHIVQTNLNNSHSQDNLNKPVPECQTILGFVAARDNQGGGGENQNSKTCKALV